ncbi:MAG: metal ABC transporter permease [Deltaproteobacteria bacterium]|nr:metal ABC transporter permease [Deltaproteobacteria bacterium]MBW1919395.1 metal ABC transporter permease [Deltaproteobacteria bacterium]MBW1934480.1 metal ABC transporter permease [Deltaproteobacteria bacterium]MBW1979142.1 metal ABC transporter permease [Deltaproteobacteria bacterium]MBW2045969.1 metal ABC transporter permease [Deltaproteobacteria bacterium]
MWEALQFEFMRNALLAGILVSIVCGILGTLIVVNRIVFISGGIAHASFGGIGLAFYIGMSPALGAAIFALAVSMVMGIASVKNKERADTVIGVMWAIGMALGIILIELTPGYNADVMSYLFGSILTVPKSDIWYMLSLDILVFFVVFFFYKEFIAMSYDEEFAFVMGIPVRLLYFVLLAMISLSVVMIIRVVGLILVIALLTIPPYIAEKYTTSLAKTMVLSSLLGMLFTTAGLWFSYNYNIASGATIIMVGGVAFFISLALDAFGGKAEAKSSI